MYPVFSRRAPASFRLRLPAVIAMLVMPALAFSQSPNNSGATAPSGNPAATPGTPETGPGLQPQSNPLNRNPARQTVTIPDISPAVDESNSSSRPTLGAVTSPDSRDTVVAPDPSRDSTSNPVANPPR
jgi:hypothetical protein